MIHTFIAKQPIFDKERRLNSYELLYRSGKAVNEAAFADANAATRQLFSDAVTLFGLRKITDEKRAFINFTDALILEGLPLLGDPNNIVIELLETIEITNDLVDRICELKQLGYVFALDDYTGDQAFDPLLPYVDIVKLDLTLTTPQQQMQITRDLCEQVVLLAEKVETEEEFDRMVECGCELFQGYYLGKPSIIEKPIASVSKDVLLYLMAEFEKDTIDYMKCAELIERDSALRDRMGVQLDTKLSPAGQNSPLIAQMLMTMGRKEARRWMDLIYAW